jgi:hypothetical protein
VLLTHLGVLGPQRDFGGAPRIASTKGIHDLGGILSVLDDVGWDVLYWLHYTADSASSVLESVRLAQEVHFKAFLEAAKKEEYWTPQWMPPLVRDQFLVHQSAPRLLISLNGVPAYNADLIHIGKNAEAAVGSD